MIEKLEIKKVPVPNNPALAKNVGMENENLFDKINELVDTVNELQTKIEILEEHAHPTARTEPADPYIEQRRWIGKLCWFWDNQEEYKFVGILWEIADNGTYFQKGGIISYLNCEPVKPDDDIIFKGE